MQKIILAPDKRLRTRCTLVTDFIEAERISLELLSVIKSITKWWNRWLGLAANQIGYSKRIVALRKGKSKYEILVNPVFVERRFPCFHVESCYSLYPKQYYLVKRYLWARIKYQDTLGNIHEMILKGPSAIYQEMDHINGIMVSDIGIRLL